ncbi:ABC transporter ATP-binding protein [Cytobacillus dafuensis]|uniref:ABC transporter ATP-binding protein n=1 Tax=Cytobacillus dafuensis TaxID=1742359 RepID=A0A5B8Z4E7_CYTDA|nr:ABC transporter ATP-binding protein [Cytobacillus dafuensis]QED46499.1 ABC transporter ATP-binding protein [Cytobacillus dafuensis]
MGTIKLESINKSYKDTKVIENLNLTINKGERLVLLGPSGCGKSTLLRIIAGLEEINSGSIQFEEKEMSHLSAGERNVAMVFQNYALYPHMNVEKNITYALKRNEVPKAEINKRLEKALDMLELQEYRTRLPKDLSGGQRQRVALARAIVKQTEYFLLDEPLSNLDAKLRVSARQSLLHLHEEFKHTFVYVTHDQVEAMALGDRIVVLKKGEIQMLDTPENIYFKPVNVFTAQFIGSPPMNIFKASLKDKSLKIGQTEIDLPENLRVRLLEYEKNEIYLGIRPEHMSISTTGLYDMTFNFIENYGSQYGVCLNFNGQECITVSNKKITDKMVKVNFDLNHLHLFDIDTEENLIYP